MKLATLFSHLPWPFPKVQTWGEPETVRAHASSIHLELVTFTDGSRAYCASRSGLLGYGYTEIQAYRALFDAIERQREQNTRRRAF